MLGQYDGFDAPHSRPVITITLDGLLKIAGSQLKASHPLGCIHEQALLQVFGEVSSYDRRYYSVESIDPM